MGSRFYFYSRRGKGPAIKKKTKLFFNLKKVLAAIKLEGRGLGTSIMLVVSASVLGGEG